MTKLTDTQCVLLAAAAKRNNLSIYPLPDSLKPGGGLSKSLAALASQGLTEERETDDKTTLSREDGDLRYGVFATPAGLAAIGIEAEGGDLAVSATAVVLPEPELARGDTKASTVLALLQREGGATLAELITATGWLPHTTRAALTGIRKKGYLVDKSKRGDVTCYRIGAVAA
ncbi:DUF3489 domain-containing protein [Sphingomonas antarctica]|uniref:DUF3489 domain-containing protein n=1 Tax=Sphingomonas antarctica TaxID=2040274 RepID=UPI0039E82578